MRSGSLGTTSGRFPKLGEIRWPVGIFELAGVVAINVIGVLQHIAGQHRDHIRVAAHDARRSLRMPARVAAEAGSQPMPHRPITALASAISCSVTFSTTPPEVTHLVERFGPRDRIADLDGGGQGFRDAHGVEARAVGCAHTGRRRAPTPSAWITARRGRRSISPSCSHLAQRLCRRPRCCPDCRPAAPPNRARASRAGPSSPP